MNRFILFLFLLTLSSAGNAQFKRTRIPFGDANADSTKVIGISGSIVSFGYIDHVTIGLHLELLGLSEMVAHGADEETPDSNFLKNIREERGSKRIYGISVSGMGFFNRGSDMHGLSINGMAGVTNIHSGVALSGLMNFARLHNGIQVAFMANSAFYLHGAQFSVFFNFSDYRSRGLQVSAVNRAADHRGIQIGIVNRADKLKGLQLGLWNINGKRKFPLINW